MAFANERKCNLIFLTCFLIISVSCFVSVFCTRDIINEIFVKKNPKNYCPIHSNEILNNEQKIKVKAKKTIENEQSKNVLDTLKVILKKVKNEVKSDVKEIFQDTPENTSNSLNETSVPNSPKEEAGSSVKLKLKDESENKKATQASITSKLKEEKVHVADFVEDTKEEDQVTVIEESENTQKIKDKIKKDKSTISSSNIITHLKNSENIFENTPQRGTLTDISDVSSVENLNIVQNASSERQKIPLEKGNEEVEEEVQDLNFTNVKEEIEVTDNSSVPLEFQNEKENKTINDSHVAAPEEVAATTDVLEESPPEAGAAEVDVNASMPDEGVVDETPKEKDQLETYSQFAERVLAEKKNGAGSSNGHSGNGQGGTKGSKVKSKNYASTDCGAKFITANPEASHSHKIINSNKDEYMLNKCTEKIWVVVELCESIKPQKFDIANFELFSNLPKEIHLYGSHRYPTRDWVSLGVFMGEEGNRDAQSFHVETQEFFKFVKLEVHSHYGTEFYCPLSLFRMYGLSEFEIIEEETEEEQSMDEEEEDGREEKEAVPEVEKGKNGIMIPDVLKAIFNGVLEVIKRGSRSGNSTDVPELTTYNQTCKSLKENFAVKNESCHFADSLNYILACYYDEYLKLLMHPLLAEVVQNSYFCHHLATIICTSPHNNDSYVYDSVCNNSYVCVMLSPKHILAMCHMNEPSLLNQFLGCGEENSETPQQSNNFSTKSNIEEIPLNVPLDIPKGSSSETEELPQNDSRNLSSESLFSPELDLQNVESQSYQHEDETLPTEELPYESSETGNVNTSDQPTNTLPPAVPETIDKSEKPTDKKKDRKPEKVNTDKTKDTEDILVPEVKAPTTTTTTTPAPTTAIPSTSSESNRGASHSNKESVVVRLSNKIKVLEHNMSISSQYLEELSRRYKRQMEDMERQFNITILALNRTSQTAYERDIYHQNRLETLENQLETLTRMISTLTEERESLLMNVIEQHMILLFIEVVVMTLVFTFCLKRQRDEASRTVQSPYADEPVRTDESKSDGSSGSLEADQQGRDTPSHYRRRSIDSIKMENEIKPKERRFSGQTVMIGSYKDLMLTENATKEKKRKKKKTNLQRSLSNVSIHESKKRSSSVSSKKERKLEKLKKSCAGVLFSGEKRTNHLIRSDEALNHETANTNDDWHVVKRNKNKKSKGDLTTDDQTYVFSSDLKRGKIALVEEPTLCDVYQEPYYSQMIYDPEYDVYEKAYIDTDYKDYVQCHYTEDLASDTVCEPIHQVYDVPDFDCNAPVINDYYRNTTDMSYNSQIIEEPERNGHSHDDETISSMWDSKSMIKSLRQPVVPPSLRGKTRLRSDNWEWYSSQPSRLNSKLSNSAEIISTSSSSDSSGRAKQINSEIKLDALKWKKKKKKGIRLTNGDGH